MAHEKLLNLCRWSSSREATFCECKKKYWFTYYGAWEGWPKTPYDTRPSIDPLASFLYMLKNMQPACMVMGSFVHKVIEKTLRSCEPSKKLPPLQTVLEEVSKAIAQGLNESSSKEWKRHPKHHVNLLEHYYGAGFSKEDGEQLQEKARTCMTNWYTSPLVQQVVLSPCAAWLGIEASQTFTVENDVEAIVVYDFFLNWIRADGTKTMLIFDWKTGQESKKIENQLLAYALAAHILSSVSLENLILTPFFLNGGPTNYKKYGVKQPNPLDETRLAETKSSIIRSARQMLALHPPKNSQGEYPAPDPCLFPYPEDKRGCRRCQFQQLCQASEYREKSCEELRCLIQRNDF